MKSNQNRFSVDELINLSLQLLQLPEKRINPPKCMYIGKLKARATVFGKVLFKNMIFTNTLSVCLNILMSISANSKQINIFFSYLR